MSNDKKRPANKIDMDAYDRAFQSIIFGDGKVTHEEFWAWYQVRNWYTVVEPPGKERMSPEHLGGIIVSLAIAVGIVVLVRLLG